MLKLNTPQDLQPGDVVFFINHYITPTPDENDENQNPYEYSYVDHVAMVTKVAQDGTVTLTHSIARDESERGKKPDGLCFTTLRPLKRQLDQYPDPHTGATVTRHYDVEYQVFRAKDPKVARRAAELMVRWRSYGIPYDNARLQWKIDLEDEQGYEGEDFLRVAKETYEDEGRFRALKFAARRERMLTRPGMRSPGRGLTCSMLLTLAFQVAEMEQHVKASDGRGYQWVSDKYADLTLIPEDMPGRDAYCAYVNSLRGPDFDMSRANKMPSLLYWQGDGNGVPLLSFTHQSFPADCKRIGAEGLHVHMQASEFWCGLGEFTPPMREYSPEDRVSYRSMVATATKSAASMQRLTAIHHEVCRMNQDNATRKAHSAPSTPSASEFRSERKPLSLRNSK